MLDTLIGVYKQVIKNKIQENQYKMLKTVFEVSKMDCPSEENLIRMKLEGQFSIKNLDFDIPNRKLTVFHQENLNEIEKAIQDLNLGGKIIQSENSDIESFKNESNQKKLLWTVLLINFLFFLIESITGILSKSMSLVADSLDMFADASVYGLSLFAVGASVSRKKKIAKLAGYFQITLALIGFVEVIRRFLGFEKLPDFSTMIIVSSLALIANALCLYLLQKSKSQEAHMKASMIFTSNDIIINIGVIIAGILVNTLNSNKPDLIIGTIVFVIVTQGAFRILKLGE
nr:cation transporter [Aureispira sp. CCB-QB1]